MKKSEFISIAIGIVIIWGITGLFKGDGFFGGITKQIDAIGDFISLIIKGALIIGFVWLIFYLLDSKRKEDKKNKE
jgi:hypothetical protein